MAIKSSGDNEQIQAEINVTPLIDIMLVLLIIFMVTSSMSLESGLDIDLPKTASNTEKKGPEAVVVSMNKEGQIFIQGKEAPVNMLKERLREAISQAQEPMVMFEGDTTSTLGRTIEIMDLAREAGAKKFAIAAEKK